MRVKPLEKFKVHGDPVYHRNGIGGIGFYAVVFSYEEDGIQRSAVATVDANDVDAAEEGKLHDPGTRILMVCPAGGIDIEETMRGDHFHEALCTAIKKYRLKR